MNLCQLFEIGHIPISLLSLHSEGAFLAHCGDTVYHISILPGKIEKSLPKISPVVLKDDQQPEWQQNSLSAIALVQEDIRSSGRAKQLGHTIVCVDQDSFHVATMGFMEKAMNVPSKLSLGSGPSKILYSSRLRKLIVLSHEVIISPGPNAGGSSSRRGKRAFRPVITFVDPTHSRSSTSAEDVDDAPGQTSREMRLTPNHRPGEKFLGLTEWNPKERDKQWHMLIVNTSIRADSGRSPCGRLLLFSIDTSNDQFRLVPRKEVSHTSPVWAVVTHPIQNKVIYSCGNELRGFSLTTLPEASNRLGVQQMPQVPLRCPARHMTIKDNLIFISTAGESIAVYEVSSSGFQYRFADRRARQGIAHLHIPDTPLIMATDVSKSLTGLWIPPQNPIDQAIETVFEAVNLPFAITRLQPLVRPVWHDSLKFSDRAMAKLTSSRNQAFLGSSSVGSLTHISLLPSSQWPLLCFLQHLAEVSSITAPFSYNDARPEQLSLFLDLAAGSDITPPESVPFLRHINGDLLLRLVERGGVDDTKRLITRGSDHALIMRDQQARQRAEEAPIDEQAAARERWTILKDLFIKALDWKSDDDYGLDPNEMIKAEDGRSALTEMVLIWVQGLLRTSF